MQHLVLGAYGDEEALCMHGQLLHKFRFGRLVLIPTGNGVHKSSCLQSLNCGWGYD